MGIVCAELEKQGYAVAVEAKPVTSSGFFAGEYEELDEAIGPVNVAVSKKGKVEQEFAIEFIDFNDPVLMGKIIRE